MDGISEMVDVRWKLENWQQLSKSPIAISSDSWGNF